MSWWDWVWAWTRDDAVWGWLRPSAAALAGAIIGGVFTLLGQVLTQRHQLLREKRTRTNVLRDQSRDDARRLFNAFASLKRDVQLGKATIDQLVNGWRWRPDWEKLWSDGRALELRFQIELLTDGSTRAALSGVVGYLDSLLDLTGEDPSIGGAVFAPPEELDLRRTALALATDGTEIVGAYLRGETFKGGQRELWRTLDALQAEHDEWVNHLAASEEDRAVEQHLEEQRLQRGEEK